MTAAHEHSPCSLLARALGLVLMKVQADLQLSEEAFAMRAGMSVAELREILHGDRELPLGSYVELAAAVEPPLGSLLLEAEKLAQTLAVRAVT